MTTALQLSLVIVVWMLALAPAAIAALTLLTYRTARRMMGATGSPSPWEDQA
jgi:hypothetical protein